MAKKNKKFIQKAHIKKGRVRSYLEHKYGKKAFTDKGTIKDSYIRKAEKETKDESLKHALNLALTLKKLHKHKK